jgi:hypothetical protein
MIYNCNFITVVFIFTVDSIVIEEENKKDLLHILNNIEMKVKSEMATANILICGKGKEINYRLISTGTVYKNGSSVEQKKMMEENYEKKIFSYAFNLNIIVNICICICGDTTE